MREAKKATLLGLAVGDALGMPFEMQPHNSDLLAGWDGSSYAGGSANPFCGHLKAGQWTDDTKMALALATSLVASHGRYSATETASRYLDWYKSGDLRGIGGTTQRSMQRMAAKQTPTGIEGAEGNGTAMRAAPIGIVFPDPDEAADTARRDAVLTHASLEAQEGAAAVAAGVSLLAAGYSREATRQAVVDILKPCRIRAALEQLTVFGAEMPAAQAVAMFADTVAGRDGGPGGPGAHVVETVPAAFAALGWTTTFKDAVEAAIKAGGDTDTTGAITGALAGTYYELREVEPYLLGLEDAKNIVAIEQQLWDLRTEHVK